jgi:hypothetical protein
MRYSWYVRLLTWIVGQMPCITYGSACYLTHSWYAWEKMPIESAYGYRCYKCGRSWHFRHEHNDHDYEALNTVARIAQESSDCILAVSRRD